MPDGGKTNFSDLIRTMNLPKAAICRVEGLFALADQLELRLAQARGQVAKLTPSLLARAFAGQLVPQNPADEPAENLLKRLAITNQKDY